ncbi:vitamin B12 dependent-methionine synthase activation domain-containing protein [Escherichia coli]
MSPTPPVRWGWPRACSARISKEGVVARIHKEYEILGSARPQAAALPSGSVWPTPAPIGSSWTGLATSRPSPASRVCRSSKTCQFRCCALISTGRRSHTWELAGKYPRILEDEIIGEEATKLFADANAMLDQLEKAQSVRCAGIIGLFPANAVGEASRSTVTSPAPRSSRCCTTCASRARGRLPQLLSGGLCGTERERQTGLDRRLCSDRRHR